MKKITLFILALSLSFTGFSQDGDSDYKWLVGANTGADVTFGDETMGAINAHALYAFTDKIMVGGELGVPLGGDADVSFSAAARLYAMDNIFISAAYDLTDDMGADVGVGYGWDVADNVDFSPTLTYNTEMEEMSLRLGFSIRF